MIYFVAFVSAIVTGALFSTAAYAMGIHHTGILIAIGIIGGGLQWIILISWYLYHTRRRARMAARTEPTSTTEQS
jgi:hypothetical protein